MIRKSIVFFICFLLSLSVTVLAVDSYQQAPEFEEKVNKGELPELEERLPENPMVLKNYEFQEIGKYGGTLKFHCQKRGLLEQRPRQMSPTSLLRFHKDLQTIRPNLAKDWEVNEDYTKVILHLREGVKWSDGVEFTAEDVVFCYNDVYYDQRVMAAPNSYALNAEGEPYNVEKLDKYTVKITSTEPSPYLLDKLAQPYNKMIYPKHYFNKFHPEYTEEEELEKKMEEYDVDDALQLFQYVSDPLEPGPPTLRAWRIVKGPPNDPTVYEANPYFWAVDEAGNQLPYIRSLEGYLFDSEDVFNMNVLDGETDFAILYSMYPQALQQERDEGNINVVNFKNPRDTRVGIWFNMNCNNKYKREIFQQKKFRVAISHAIDREEIREMAFNNVVGEAAQTCPPPGTPYHHPELAKQYLEHDLDKANKLLNELGLEWDENQEWRVLPNGERFSIVMVSNPADGNITDTKEILGDQLKEVGIEVHPVARGGGEIRPKMRAGEVGDFESFLWPGWGYTDLFNGNPSAFVPYKSVNWWGPDYGRWFASNGKEGVEPPPEVKKVQELYDKGSTTIDPEKRHEIGMEILDVAKENLWSVGIAWAYGNLFVFDPEVKNIPEEYIRVFGKGVVSPLDPEKWYFEE